MEKDYLILKRASASRSSGEWNDDDFDVLADGVVVGRIFKANAAPVDAPWMWTLLLEHHKDRTPTHGYAETREDASTMLSVCQISPLVRTIISWEPRLSRGTRPIRYR